MTRKLFQPFNLAGPMSPIPISSRGSPEIARLTRSTTPRSMVVAPGDVPIIRSCRSATTADRSPCHTTALSKGQDMNYLGNIPTFGTAVGITGIRNPTSVWPS